MHRLIARVTLPFPSSAGSIHKGRYDDELAESGTAFLQFTATSKPSSPAVSSPVEARLCNNSVFLPTGGGGTGLQDQRAGKGRGDDDGGVVAVLPLSFTSPARRSANSTLGAKINGVVVSYYRGYRELLRPR
jgi:hypothetical protein